MKKLMIAAAAAAMIGAAQADTVPLTYGWYDFSACVKTTTGKKGADVTKKTNYTVYLGQDADGIFWWDAKGFKNAAAGKAYINSLSNDEKEAYAIDELGFDTATGLTDYPFKSQGKWCATFKYTHTDFTAGRCYRVATTETFKGYIFMDNCCGYGTDYTKWNFCYDPEDPSSGVEINNRLLFRFGAQTLAKATKVEYLGVFGKLNNGDKRNEAPYFVMAGQGDWSDKLGKDANNDYVAGIKSISGNIVGTCPASTCAACCEYDTDAIAFYCDATTDDDIAWKNAKKELMQDTAAFGTWTLKLNKKLSSLK